MRLTVRVKGVLLKAPRTSVFMRENANAYLYGCGVHFSVVGVLAHTTGH